MFSSLPHLSIIGLVKMVGYPGLFAVVFAESGLFFAFFLPGSSMLFTAGLLASAGYFDIWTLIVLITIASILGDSTGYWFGSVVGHAFFQKKDSRFFKREYLEQAREFYEKHGVIAVVFARFVPIVRTFAPIVAGIAGMRYRHFLFYNVIGGILWAGGTAFAGYFLGTRIPGIDRYITPIVLVIILVSILPILHTALQRRRGSRGQSPESPGTSS